MILLKVYLVERGKPYQSHEEWQGKGYLNKRMPFCNGKDRANETEINLVRRRMVNALLLSLREYKFVVEILNR